MNGKDFLVRVMKGKDGVIAMTGMVNREVTKMDEELEVDLGGGLDRRSGIRFLSPFICWTMKSYLVNQFLRRSNCLSGSVLFL